MYHRIFFLPFFSHIRFLYLYMYAYCKTCMYSCTVHIVLHIGMYMYTGWYMYSSSINKECEFIIYYIPFVFLFIFASLLFFRCSRASSFCFLIASFSCNVLGKFKRAGPRGRKSFHTFCRIPRMLASSSNI